jgi:3-oxoacyl-[acyl-carrier protein] reductase
MMRDQVIIVTGASQGIGEEAVRTFSRQGASMVLVARNEQKMVRIGQELDAPYLICPTDVRNEQSVSAMVAKTMQTFGRIDVLINNAGTVEPLGLLDMELSDWQEMIDTNLTGTFLCTRETVKYMKKHGGRIINIASSAGLSPRPGWSGYAASKAGVINFSQTMAEELRIYKILVFCICPGRTATNLRRRLAPNEDPTTIMQPHAVVDTIAYCLSPEAHVLEGQALQVRER